jgi:DNA-binding IclR family transcriptional regulator
MARSKPRSNRLPINKSYSAPALEKGMDVIEALADADSGLTVSEIAAKLKRPMSELFRIIVVMQQRGWLQKDPVSSRYSVSYLVLRLAHRSTPAQSLSAAASPVMHELSIRINQSCHLVVRSGMEGLVLLRQENQRRHANLSVRVGAIIDLATSCSGLNILAHLADEERDRAIPRARNTAAFKAKLNRIRKLGHEVHRSPVTAGVTDIGCPIFGFDGQVIAALTVPYLHVLDNSVPTSIEQTIHQVEQATRRISRSMGWAE